MSGEIITIIVSALVAAVSGPVGAWVGRKLERAKYRIELETLRAEMNNKLAEVKSNELENVRKAADILMESIVPPLKAEITNLRNDVQRLNKALERIWGCRHIDSCPVKFELLYKDHIVAAQIHMGGQSRPGPIGDLLMVLRYHVIEIGGIDVRRFDQVEIAASLLRD